MSGPYKGKPGFRMYWGDATFGEYQFVRIDGNGVIEVHGYSNKDELSTVILDEAEVISLIDALRKARRNIHE